MLEITQPQNPNPQYVTATPTTGQTVSFNDNGSDQVFYINPAAPLLALNVNVPSNLNSRLGQRIYFCVTKAVTNLTIQNASSILNNVTAVTGNELLCLIKIADNTWAQEVSI